MAHINFEELLSKVIKLAEASHALSAADRAHPDVGLHVAVMALESWSILQARCVLASVRAEDSRGAIPNTRAVFEALVTLRYLADPTVDDTQRERRQERYFRGVRRAQVEFRKALDEYPGLRAAFVVDAWLIDRERLEYEQAEAARPPAERLGKHWSGEPVGLKSLAKIVGLGADYAVLYRMASGAAHSNRPWDEVVFDPDAGVILPVVRPNANLGGAVAFDAMRYLAWIVQMSHELGVAPLYQSDQKVLAEVAPFLQPLDILFRDNIVGTGFAPPTG